MWNSGLYTCIVLRINLFLTMQEAESGSSDLCSELYRGPSPGSELEVKAISGFHESLGRVIGVVDFHSYHQEVLYPPGRWTS
jgi:hypothetical protein